MISIFSALSKYPSTPTRSQLENYTTEALVYLLQLSKNNQSLLLVNFLKLFGIPFNIKYNKIEISTQESFNTRYGLRSIPDITIRISNLNNKPKAIYFIEVKVDSGINKYITNNKEIDQIKKYQGIISNPPVKKENISLLSKLHFSSQTLVSKNILWFQIADLLRDELKRAVEIEKYLIGDFIKYLEDNFLSLTKINNSVEPGLSSLLSIMNNINIILDGLNIKKVNPNIDFGCGWFGYDLIKKNFIFIGLYKKYQNQLFFDVYDDKLIKKTEKSKGLFKTFYHEQFDEERLTSIFYLDESFFKKDVKEQNTELSQWIKSCCKHLKLC